MYAHSQYGRNHISAHEKEAAYFLCNGRPVGGCERQAPDHSQASLGAAQHSLQQGALLPMQTCGLLSRADPIRHVAKIQKCCLCLVYVTEKGMAEAMTSSVW